MKKEIIVMTCDHICSGNCRREGCNCEHGEYHMEEIDNMKSAFDDFMGEAESFIQKNKT